MHHLSSAWDSLVSLWRSKSDLKRQLRETRAALRKMRDQKHEVSGLAADRLLTTHELRERIEALEHTVKLRDSKIGLLELEIETLTAVNERNFERVKKETAAFTYQQARLLDHGEERVDDEEL